MSLCLLICLSDSSVTPHFIILHYGHVTLFAALSIWLLCNTHHFTILHYGHVTLCILHYGCVTLFAVLSVCLLYEHITSLYHIMGMSLRVLLCLSDSSVTHHFIILHYGHVTLCEALSIWLLCNPHHFIILHYGCVTLFAVLSVCLLYEHITSL